MGRAVRRRVPGRALLSHELLLLLRDEGHGLVVEDELAPEQKGKTRATLKVSGWSLVYVLPLSLSLPVMMDEEPSS